jgi:hypothetical protein
VNSPIVEKCLNPKRRKMWETKTTATMETMKEKKMMVVKAKNALKSESPPVKKTPS